MKLPGKRIKTMRFCISEKFLLSRHYLDFKLRQHAKKLSGKNEARSSSTPTTNCRDPSPPPISGLLLGNGGSFLAAETAEEKLTLSRIATILKKLNVLSTWQMV
ncbi:hypothetical protein WA026_011676 [Henosepilachna vigintioctopunctata]|uniref:Uncharacterized protein n=1 Tax=Henosepilachna vigintioctopunctata TaxID=420089 RepID=A0AAW1UBP2_9CUCU